MVDINDVLQIARVFKSQAEADLMNDIYSKVLPTNMISFCDAVIELLKEKQPKKVKDFQYLADLFVGKCPSCGEELNNEVYPAFCGFCGQRISWKDGEQE